MPEVFEGDETMRSNKTVLTVRAAAQRSIAVGLAFLMGAVAPMQVRAQGSYHPLGAPRLNQLVAPIALYPDSLVAQVLTATTFPRQITDANNYVQQNSGLSPNQVAAAVDGLPWDPSVKALTAFPSVLDNLARNISWASALGNAYYNQPADVMNAVQAMRFQARRAGNLGGSEQLRVYDEGPQIVIAPVNPAFVYVPYYNPWGVYGAPIPAYAGFYYGGPPRGVVVAGLIGFAAVAVGVGIWAHYNWGYHAWSPNWGGGNVTYNHNTYISNSTTVINRGNFGSFNRGAYERAGAGVPQNFRPPVTGTTAGFTGRAAVAGTGAASNPNVNSPAAAARQVNPNIARPANAARPAQGQFSGRSLAQPPASPGDHAPATASHLPPHVSSHPQPNVAHPKGGEGRQQARPPAAEHHAAIAHEVH